MTIGDPTPTNVLWPLYGTPQKRYGWICPKCNRGVSPDMTICPACPSGSVNFTVAAGAACVAGVGVGTSENWIGCTCGKSTRGGPVNCEEKDCPLLRSLASHAADSSK